MAANGESVADLFKSLGHTLYRLEPEFAFLKTSQKSMARIRAGSDTRDVQNFACACDRFRERFLRFFLACSYFYFNAFDISLNLLLCHREQVYAENLEKIFEGLANSAVRGTLAEKEKVRLTILNLFGALD